MSKPDTQTTLYNMGMYDASKLLDVTNDELRLVCGELSAQEILTVRAVLNWMKYRILDKAKSETPF